MFRRREVEATAAEEEVAPADRDDERDRIEECVGRANAATDLRLLWLLLLTLLAVAGLFLAALLLAVPERAVLLLAAADDGRGLLADADAADARP